MLKHISSIKGFTILEVLITVLVFSIGLLGLASLQITGLKLEHDSALRTTATILAGDMADRMRANYSAMTMGTSSPYNNPTGASTGNAACLGKNSAGQETNTQCTASEMAAHDFFEWYGALRGQAASSWYPAIAQLLPSGNGIVCIDSTPEDGVPPPGNPMCDGIITTSGKPVFAIKIWWQERKDQNSPGTLQQFVTSFSP